MKKNTKSDMLAFYVIVLLIIACVSVLPKWEKNENKPENLLDTSTKEYMETVACIVGLSYSGDEMFQHKNVSTTRFPYMNFEIICKHETEECMISFMHNAYIFPNLFPVNSSSFVLEL